MRLRHRITALLLAIVLSASVVPFFPEATAKADDLPPSSDGFFDPDLNSEDPADPQDEPTDPADDPADPQDDPTDPADDPADPQDEPTDPADDPEDPEDEEPADASEDESDTALLCEDGIRLYHFEQLLAIGTDAAVTDADFSEDAFGTGEPVLYEDGTPAVYSSIASYYIVNDILLPQGGEIQSTV